MRKHDDFFLHDVHIVAMLNQIRRNDQVERVEPRVMKVLLDLAAVQGRTVPREILLASSWPDDAHTHDEALTKAISQLRKALGDDARHPRFIETIPKTGYRLIAPVRLAADTPQVAAPEKPATAPLPASRHGQRWLWAAVIVLAVLTTAPWLFPRRDVPTHIQQRVRVVRMPAPATLPGDSTATNVSLPGCVDSLKDLDIPSAPGTPRLHRRVVHQGDSTAQALDDVLESCQVPLLMSETTFSPSG